MQCNIDARGKRARLLVGLGFLFAAVVLGVLVALTVLPVWVGWIALGAGLGGGFAVFEARHGWCAVRAMGFKTPI